MLKKHFFHFAIAVFFTFSTASAVSAAEIRGTVLETMNSGGYTYMHVDTGSAKQWVAIPESQIAKGQEVTYHEGMEMKDFHSKSLDKTFASIIFSGGLVAHGQTATADTTTPEASEVVEEDSFAAAVAKENQATQSQNAQIITASGGSSGAIVPLTDAKVEKASGDNGYTVEQIFSKAEELNGKEVRVHGKVVKFSPNIMGRNWIHIQDGTGDPMQNTHDLVVTSADLVDIDSTVTLKGILAAKKDFGAGYKYEAIVEQAIVE